MHPYFNCSVIYNGQDRVATQMPINRWVDKKLWDIYTVEYYSTVKRKKILPFATVWMDLENIMLSEISQAEKGKAIWFHSYVESNEQTKLTRKIETDS